MSSKMEIPKTCNWCGKEYIAKKTTTKFCGHNCARSAWKEKNRSEKIKAACSIVIQEPKVQEKDFLTITESARLLGISERTLFRMMVKKLIKPLKFNRRVVIPKSELFKTSTYENLYS
jgi:predicted DNA-binding transcriptional regulator AlpA